MKIKLLIGIPGYAPGAILEATPAPHYAANNPKWFIGETITGVYAYEAEEIQEESDYETEEDQSAPLPVLQTEDDGRVVAPARRSDTVLDVPMLSAQPTRQASEDGNKYL